jgi:flagellar biosynthetic protein FliQ
MARRKDAMDTSEVMEVLREAIVVAIKLAGPMLVLCMLVGVLVAVFQAVTQIHEQTISFILKLVVVILVLAIGGSWMLTTLLDYFKELLALIAG